MPHHDVEQINSFDQLIGQSLTGFVEKIVIPPGEALLQVVGNVGGMLAAAQARAVNQPDGI